MRLCSGELRSSLDGLPWQEFLRLFFLGLQGTCVQPSMLIDIHPNWQRYLFKWATCNGLTTFWERFFVTSSYLNASDDSSFCACLRLFLTCTMVNHHQTTIWRPCFTFSNHLMQIQAVQMMIHQRNTFRTTPEVRNGEWFLCPVSFKVTRTRRLVGKITSFWIRDHLAHMLRVW